MKQLIGMSSSHADGNTLIIMGINMVFIPNLYLIIIYNLVSRALFTYDKQE